MTERTKPVFPIRFACIDCGPTNHVVTILHRDYCVPCLGEHLVKFPKATVARLAIPR